VGFAACRSILVYGFMNACLWFFALRRLLPVAHAVCTSVACSVHTLTRLASRLSDGVSHMTGRRTAAKLRKKKFNGTDCKINDNVVSLQAFWVHHDEFRTSRV